MAKTEVAAIFLTVYETHAGMTLGHIFGEHLIDGFAAAGNLMIHLLDMYLESIADNLTAGESTDLA